METIGLYTNQTLLLTGAEAKNEEEIIRLLAGKALEQGLIEPEFITAVLAREKEYPTGLPTAVPIAIPHIHDGCLKSFFSMAVLKEPVSFKCMGDPDETVDAPLVFLFGITDPSYQTAVLKKFSTIFQDEEVLQKLKDMTDPEDLMHQMKGLLDTYLVTE